MQGIDAPETKQYCKAADKKTKIPCGKIATEKLKEIIGNNKVTCSIKGTDRYKRKLGYCYAGGININKEMVSRGYAFAYVKYDKSFENEEIEARKQKLGFWSGEFKNPEVWRRENMTSYNKKNMPKRMYIRLGEGDNTYRIAIPDRIVFNKDCEALREWGSKQGIAQVALATETACPWRKENKSKYNYFIMNGVKLRVPKVELLFQEDDGKNGIIFIEIYYPEMTVDWSAR